MSRKIRSDSVLDSMPLHQQDALIEWLMEESLSPGAAKDRLWQDFAVKTSETALGTFWHRYCAPRLLRRAAQAASGFAEEADGLGKDWSEPSKAMIRQKHFELLASQYPDPKELALYAGMIASVERSELEHARLEFDQRRHVDTAQQKREELALSRAKFETDASVLALKFVAELKTISANRALTEPAKIDAVRRTMFGASPTKTEVAS